MTKAEYNREYYLTHRDKVLTRAKAYKRDYASKGLRKPRKRQPRSIRDHERYMEHQEERQARQREYYREHPDYYKRKRREWEQRQRDMIYE